MLRLLPILFLLFSSCQSQSFTEVTGVWTPVSNNETLGSLSELFYGHENLWELLAGSNKRSSFELSSPDNALTKDTIVTSKILIPPASNCPSYMNSSCLQILNYLEEKHNGLKDDETISELLRTKLNLDTPLVWDTRIKEDATTTLPQEDGSRTLQDLEPMELFLISWDISTLFRENLGLTAKNNVTRGTFALNIINQTPKTLTDFEFLSDQCGSSPSQSFWSPLLIEPGKTGQVISQQRQDTDTGVVKVRVDDKNSFLITWRNENLTSLPTEAHVLRMMPDTVQKEAYFSDQYVCSSPQGWTTKRLNYRYSIQAFVGGTQENRVANLIISEDWKDEEYNRNDIYPQALYTILNHPKTFRLTASTNYSDPINPIYQAYQSNVNYGKYQEWRIDLVELSGTQEMGYLIRNSQSGLVLSAIELNKAVLQRYAENDKDKLRAQLWRLKLLDDNSYHIQNLKFKTFLSTEGKTNNYAFWTLKASVNETKVSERFFLEFLTVDKGSLAPLIQENYYYSFAPEKFADMKVTPRKDSDSVQILYPSSSTTAGTPDINMGYWLLKRVTLPASNITGYLIMNHYLNVVLTMSENKTLITKKLEKNTNPTIAESQLWQITLNQSVLTRTSYTISNTKDRRYFVSLNGTSHGSQLVLTRNPDTGFIFTNSDVKGYIPYRYSTPYHINSFSTLEPYVVGAGNVSNAASNGAIIGSRTTGEKQKWSINAALWGPTDALTLRSNDSPQSGTGYYLTTINGAPQLVLLDLINKQLEQSWKLVADPEYYDLVYQIKPFNWDYLCLTTPVNKTVNADFILTNVSESQDQRFRFMVANEAFPFLTISTLPPTQLYDDNFYFQLSPETASQLKVTVSNADNSTLTLSSGIPIRSRQYWLLKRVTLPGTTIIGTIIMNHELNVVLTLQENMTANAAIMAKANSSDNTAVSQLWDIQKLDDSSYTIRSFRYPDYYLNLNLGVSVSPSLFNLYKHSAGESPLGYLTSYLISTAFTREPYVLDTSNSRGIYGNTKTGYVKQRWALEGTADSSSVNALKTLYKYPGDDTDYYLFARSDGGGETNIGVRTESKWNLEPDTNYYGLFYKIRSNWLSNRYLTAPDSKASGANFKVSESNSTNSQNQIFRFMNADEVELVSDDHYHELIPETNDNLRLTATNNIATKIEIQSLSPNDKKQSWLFRRTSFYGITGYVILNEEKNAAITLSNDKVIGATVINLKYLPADAVSQVWDFENLGGGVYRIRSFRNPNYYLTISGTSLIPSTSPSSFKLSRDPYRTGSPTLKQGVFHQISVPSKLDPYVLDFNDANAVFGNSITESNRQYWELKRHPDEDLSIYVIQTKYAYPLGPYLNHRLGQVSTAPKLDATQKWKVQLDEEYHSLYFTIEEYPTTTNDYRLLTAPVNKNNGALFTLEFLLSVDPFTPRRLDTRFKITDNLWLN